MRDRARGFFIAGSAGLALGGVLHLWGQFAGDEPPLARAAIEAAMKTYKIHYGVAPPVVVFSALFLCFAVATALAMSPGRSGIAGASKTGDK